MDIFEIMLSIIVPAYNEEDRIRRCLEPTIDFLIRNKISAEIIVVADGCTDNTESRTRELTEKFGGIRIISYSPNKGKGFAVRKGMLEAAGEIRIFMDADYAVPIGTVLAFIKAADNGSDLVIGSRGHPDTKIRKHQMFMRELAGKAFGRIQKKVLRIPYYDTQCGFKLFTARAAEFLFPQVKFECSYFDAEVMYIAHRSGMKVKELPVDWTHDGMTRMPIGPARIFDLFRKMFKIRKIHSNIKPYNAR